MQYTEGSIRSLVNRLRGIYTVPIRDGAGPIDGKMEFTQTFGNLPPINYEAALAIEFLLNELSRHRETHGHD